MSKKRNKARMKAMRAKAKKGGTALMPKALVRRLYAQGIDPTRYLATVPVSLDDYRALERTLDARTQRVEWQSGGIRMLRGELETLKATIATMPAMQDSEVLQRLIQVEAGQVLHEAAHDAPQESSGEVIADSDAVEAREEAARHRWMRGRTRTLTASASTSVSTCGASMGMEPWWWGKGGC